MTDADYDTLMKAMWYSVRSAGNTRTKRGQVPRLLISVVYKPGEEFQFGNLSDYMKLKPSNGKPEIEWASPEDYVIDLSLLARAAEESSPADSAHRAIAFLQTSTLQPAPQGIRLAGRKTSLIWISILRRSLPRSEP